ncbi:MAG: NBR1-Ig-like domain-containing protein [Planctomycetota bacterium]|jgi:hypothetical protein
MRIQLFNKRTATAGLMIVALLAITTGAQAFTEEEFNPYGICCHIDGQDQNFDDMEDCGIRWLRWGEYWSSTETSQGTFNWSWWDSMVQDAEERNIIIYSGIENTPAWATNGNPGTGVPSSTQYVYDYAYALADRYPQIKYWGMWNEPNYNKFFDGTTQQYIDYILIPGANGIRAANPTAMIVAPECTDLSSPTSPQNFIDAVLDSASDYVDVISTHVYDDSMSDIRSHLKNDIKPVLDSHDWNGMFWLPETGWKSTSVGESGQSSRYQDFLDDWFVNGSTYNWMDKVFFYMLQDLASDWNYSYGIVGPSNGSPPYRRKQAFTTYANWISSHSYDRDWAVPVYHSIPNKWKTGTTYRGMISMQNVGTTTWTRGTNYRLGGVDDSDPFANTRYYLPNDTSFESGDQFNFYFNMTAPSTAGTYTTDWRMLKELVRWFGTEAEQVVTVTSMSNDAQYISHTIPPCMETGNTYNVMVRMKNNGTSTWTKSAGYKLGMNEDDDPFNTSVRVQLDSGDSIATGQQKSFSFTMTAPDTPGYYVTDYRMLKEGVEWFGEIIPVWVWVVPDGEMVSVDLGTTDVTNDLQRPATEPGNGTTEKRTKLSVNCRRNVVLGSDKYIYFQVADSWAYNGNRPDVIIAFNYYDNSTGYMKLQYDSTGSAKYKSGGVWYMDGTNKWRTAWFRISDAGFRNRQSQSCDFRVFRSNSLRMFVDHVTVHEPQDYPEDFY